MSERIGTTDAEWALIAPPLPAERGRGYRPAGHNRSFFDGMMWMARTGVQRRRLPSEYGKWNSMFRRYRRCVETGVFDALLETLVELAGRDRSADMIDSTVVHAHHCVAWIEKGLDRPRHLAGRTAASPLGCTRAAVLVDCRSASC